MSRKHPVAPLIPWLLLACTIAGGPSLCAQEEGGEPAAFLLREAGVARVGMIGSMAGEQQLREGIVGNPATLAWVPHPLVSLTSSFLPAGQQWNAGGGALPIGRFGGLAASIESYGVSDYRGMTADERPTGSFSSRDIALSLSGGLAIGPAGLGATVTLIRMAVDGVSGGRDGLTVDLAGTLRFEDRLGVGVIVENLAGELRAPYATSPRESIPTRVRLGGSWLEPFERRTTGVRSDPTGLAEQVPLPPRRYLLVSLEATVEAGAGNPSAELGGEWAPMSEIPLALRLGAGTRGSFSAGFSYRLPLAIGEGVVLATATRFDPEFPSLTQHVTLTAGF